MQPVGRWLALDYGRRRIGMALSDELGISCRPLKSLDLGRLQPGVRAPRAGVFEPGGALLDEAARRITAECVSFEVRGLVVGEPRHASGDRMPIAMWIDEQIVRLQTALEAVGLRGLPIARVDEHGSSQEALERLGGGGSRERELRAGGRIDAAAAALILQAFLSSGGPRRALDLRAEEPEP